MPSLTLPDRLIWFAHCPKAGGTSIEALMVETWGPAVAHLHWGWDRWWHRGGWRVADPPNSPQHLIWEDAAPLLEHPPHHVFALVRHPVARLLSEHRYQRQVRRATWAGRLVAALPFSIWLRLMLAVCQRAPYAFDNHLRPQGDFIPDHATVFTLEAGTAPVVDWLSRITGQPGLALPGHALKTRAHHTASAADIARIEAFFEADYRRFGYPLTRPKTAPKSVWDGVVRFGARIIATLDRRGLL